MAPEHPWRKRQPAPAELRVYVTLKNGRHGSWETDDLALARLEQLKSARASFMNICDQWLGSKVQGEVQSIRVLGHRSDGRSIDLFLECDPTPPAQT